MIAFGGIIFWTIILCFILAEAVFVWAEQPIWNIFISIAFVALLWFGINDLPTIQWKYLLFYPLGCIIWLPVYWYLSLKRTARELKKHISKFDSISAAYKDFGYGKHYLKEHFNYLRDDDVKIDIKHPPVDLICQNALLFPVSVPIFLSENWIEMLHQALLNKMEEIRKRISDSIG